MLFNSFSFICVFLPITLGLWWGIHAWAGLRWALCWLVLASLVFYAVWDVRYLALLLTSVAVNFWVGGNILAAKAGGTEALARGWLLAGVTFNLLLLGTFKYAYFVAANVFALLGQSAPFEALVLPLAISFVTFQKIAYLVDCRRGQVNRHNLLDYLFFVSFFPQLIAGPIVHHRPLIAQTQPGKNPLLHPTAGLATGLTFFAIGLFKKVVLADSLARYATPVFELARHSVAGTDAAWLGTLAFTLQLYFDFSGYSDMAIGLALMFGFKLPVNFASPYKAASIIDFWRRWHITLSGFLRDYLYIPLGGNQHGVWARWRNVWVTMLLAGLWHGAGWTFLLWGALHGVLLSLNQLWRMLLAARPGLAGVWRRVPAAPLVALTFMLTAWAWVLFRAADLATALRMYQGLLHWPPGGMPWQPLGGRPLLALLEGLVSAADGYGWVWVALGLLGVLVLPSTVQWLRYSAQPNTPCAGRPGWLLGGLTGVCLWLALKWMATRPPTEFLYFNF